MTVVPYGDLTLSMTLRYHASAGWSSLVARWARFCGELIRWLLATSERSLLTMNGLCRKKLLYDHLSNSGKPVAG